MFIDTHAHLNYPDFKKNITAILERAQLNGVEKIIVPATDLKSSIEIIELVQKYEILFGAVGIHPTELNDFKESHLYKIEELSKENKIVAIGEIGLDYYWKPFDAEKEKYIFRSQLQIAKRKNLPVIIHNRESSADIMVLVEQEYDNARLLNGQGKLKGQFHSFSGDEAMARRCVELGFYISFTGNITYKPNEKTLIAQNVIIQTPLENILLETDSPYLPPVPYRGKQNEPSYLKHTAEKIAELKGISVDNLGRVTSENASKLYNLNM